MKNTTARRIRARAATVAALTLMAVGGLASASHADATECTGYSACEDHGYAGANGTSYWNMFAGHNCTNYVAYRLVALGMPNSRPWANNGEAGDWKAGAESAEYIVNTTPVVGAVAWWAPDTGGHGASGHVAYVESVNGDGTITISEDNWGGNFFWKTVSLSSGVQFLHIGSPFDNVGVPSTGTEHQVGDVLQVEPGTWSPAPSLVQRQWYRDGNPISGETGDSYELTQQDIGTSITVVETAYAQGRRATQSASAPVVVTAQQFDGMAIVSVLGVPHLGNTLSADLDTSMFGFEQQYQWKRGTQDIPGATEQFYAPTTADLGSQLSVAITLSRAGYQDKTITSGWTAAVEPAAVVMSDVTITGTPHVDYVLYANVDVPTVGANVTYQWKRNGANIGGAVNSYYGVTAADVGANITVTVTASKATYDTTTKTSTPVIGALSTISMSGVTLGGTARVFSTLTANVSVSTAGTSVSYQWYRNGTTLVGTGSSYSPTIYDNGAVISVNVTVSKPGYATAYRNSAGVSIAPALMGTFYATAQGTNRVEYTLSAAVTSATPGVTLTYYWKRNGSTVSTGSSYTLQPADIGQTMTLTVTGAKSGYATSTSTYGIGTTAGYLSYSFSGAPATVSGTRKVGYTLTAATALQTSGVTITYRWYRGSTPLSATGRTYTVTSADKGKTISVRIYFDKLGYQATSSLSPAVTIS